jgi:hypothetical protein
MDNLVSVYKSMEVASGINIFVTQNAPSTKFSGDISVNTCDTVMQIVCRNHPAGIRKNNSQLGFRHIDIIELHMH